MPTTKVGLTTHEHEALTRLDSRYRVLTREVELTAKGHSTGLAVWGEGGIGKSYQVEKTLRGMEIKFKKINSRLTGAGFVDILEKFAKSVILVEDIEDVFDEKNTMNLLRSALWGQEDESGYMVRPITWQVQGSAKRPPKSFNFDGQIIFTANRNLADIPELRAMRTRIPFVRLNPERDEIFAVAKQMALKGYSWWKGSLEVGGCLEVFEFYKENIPVDMMPNLRTLVRGFRKVIGLQEMGKFEEWQSIFKADIQGDIDPQPNTPASELVRLTMIANELRRRFGNSLVKILPEWSAKTGKGKDAYYDALKRGNQG